MSDLTPERLAEIRAVVKRLRDGVDDPAYLWTMLGAPCGPCPHGPGPEAEPRHPPPPRKENLVSDLHAVFATTPSGERRRVTDDLAWGTDLVNEA